MVNIIDLNRTVNAVTDDIRKTTKILTEAITTLQRLEVELAGLRNRSLEVDVVIDDGQTGTGGVRGEIIKISDYGRADSEFEASFPPTKFSTTAQIDVKFSTATDDEFAKMLGDLLE